MKRIYNILLLGSFIFLVIFLIRQEYIVPTIIHPWYMFFSFLLLFAGFYSSTLSWRTALASHGIKCSRSEALISHGQSVFAKYIPGKIWVILGRAGYISNDKKELKNHAFISLKEQLIYLWAGFLISCIPTIIFYGIQWVSILVALTIAGLSLFLFIKPVHTLLLSLIHRITRKSLDIPHVKFTASFPMIGAVLLIWIFWTAGFYLFMLALSTEITPIMMFAFPLSVSFGLLAVILPGGLGLREGIIIGYLVLAGLDIESASTISIMNRFWFICGELFIFLLASLVRVMSKKRA